MTVCIFGAVRTRSLNMLGESSIVCWLSPVRDVTCGMDGLGGALSHLLLSSFHLAPRDTIMVAFSTPLSPHLPPAPSITGALSQSVTRRPSLPALLGVVRLCSIVSVRNSVVHCICCPISGILSSSNVLSIIQLFACIDCHCIVSHT